MAAMSNMNYPEIDLTIQEEKHGEYGRRWIIIMRDGFLSVADSLRADLQVAVEQAFLNHDHKILDLEGGNHDT